MIRIMFMRSGPMGSKASPVRKYITKVRIAFIPSGSIRAVIKREPMKVNQNIESSVDATPSLMPLRVINVVAQAAVAASIGT